MWIFMKELFKNRKFMLLWLGQSISGLGNWINFIGLNLYVLHTFNSGNILGMFLVVRMLPAVLFGSIGGYLADRFNKKRLMIFCDIMRAIIVLSFLFTKDIVVFFSAGLLLSILDKIFLSAKGALIPELIEKEQLMGANSLNEMANSVVTVLGPALGGLLLTIFNYKVVFIADSLTFIASVICLLLISYSFSDTGSKRDRTGLLSDFIDEYKTTFRFVYGQTMLFIILVLRLVDAFCSGTYNISLPIFAREFVNLKIMLLDIEIKKGAAYGILVGVWALGAFLGSYLSRKILDRFEISIINLFSCSLIIMAISMGFVFWGKTFLFVLVAILIGGIADGISNVLFTTTLMKESTLELRGKIFGTLISMVYTSAAVGMFLGGFLLDHFPIRYITLTASTAAVVIVIIVRIIISLKKKNPII
jgi:MFS transporter, DHA3 family, macrolide efflux protein